MKRILIAGLAAFGIALVSAATVLPAAPNGTVTTAAIPAGGYSHAHVLQPGSRSSVVEI